MVTTRSGWQWAMITSLVGEGSDTYLFGRGDGMIVIVLFDRTLGRVDVLQLWMKVLLQSDIRALTRVAHNLVVTNQGHG